MQLFMAHCCPGCPENKMVKHLFVKLNIRAGHADKWKQDKWKADFCLCLGTERVNADLSRLMEMMPKCHGMFLAATSFTQ